MFGAAMPETAINHDHDAGATENDVGPAAARAEQGYVDSIAQSSTVKFTAQRQLRRSVADLLTLKPCPHSW